MSRGRVRRLIYFILAAMFCTIMTYKLQICVNDKRTTAAVVISSQSYLLDNDSKMYHYNRDMPIIFIGGVPRSGTTLMRAMLDAHPEIRCGQETRVIPRILQMRQHWMKSVKEKLRLEEAGISTEVLNSAVASFVLEIIARHGEPARRLCNKDPLTLKSGDYLMELFPNAKFIFMVRDGRATVHSIISRKVSITGFDLSDYEQCMRKWNDAVSIMFQKCVKIGSDRCMIVYYEQLVLHPKEWMTVILKFLDVPWNNSVLHHEELINKPGGVILSKVERSSDQVIKPVNLEALTKWVGHFPEDVLKNIDTIAPMLARLGYDPYSSPPNYGSPDAFVYNNTEQIKKFSALWKEKAVGLLAMADHNLFPNLFANETADEVLNNVNDNNNDSGGNDKNNIVKKPNSSGII